LARSLYMPGMADMEEIEYSMAERDGLTAHPREPRNLSELRNRFDLRPSHEKAIS
jgi:hypothetical protein